MPPQQDQQPSPPSPDPQYDFIFNDQQKPHAEPSSKLPKLSKPVLIGAALFAVLIIIVSLVVFGGGSDNSLPVVSATARGHEIARVSGLVEQQSTDANTKALAATIKSTLTSEEVEIINYLSQAGVKVGSNTLQQFQNPETDKQIESAAQENRLEQTYNAYLKTNLEKYLSDLKSASSDLQPKGKQIVNGALLSGGVILSSPQLKSL